MSNHLSHAALPYPVKKARFTVAVPYRASTGIPTDPTTPDTEVSIDGAAFADCAEEVTTVTGSNGFGYITLTGAETDGSLILIAAKAASGPLTTLMMLNPRVLPILESGTAQSALAGTITLTSGAAAFDLSGCIVRTTGGTGGGGTGGANNQARVITSYNTSTKVATVSPDWETTPSSDTTYDILVTEMATNAIITRGLRPTTDGRTLDVSSTGEAGLDWANVGSPTTTLNLSGTTVKTATDVETDTADIQTRLPAALGANGNIKADVRDFGGTAATTSGGRPEVNTTHAAGTAWGSGAITAATFAAGAVDAAAIAADAGSEIATAVWASGTRTITALDEDSVTIDLDATIRAAVGLASANLDNQLTAIDDYLDTEVAAIKAKTDQLTFSTANRVDSQVYGVEAGAITAIRSYVSGTADSGSTTTMVDAARTEGDADYWKGYRILFTSGTIAGQVVFVTDFDQTTDTFTFHPATTQAVATNTYELLPPCTDTSAVWDEPIAGHNTAGTTGEALNNAGSAGDPWSTALPGAYGAGTAGAIVGAMTFSTANRLDVQVFGIENDAITAAAIADGAIDAATFAAGAIDATAIAAGAIDAATFAAGAIDSAAIAAGAITATTFAAGAIDAAAIAADAGTEIADAVWATTVPGILAAGTAGYILGQFTFTTANRVDAQVFGIETGAIAAASFAAGAIDAAAIADGAIDAATFAAGAIDAAAIADASIDAATFAAGAIDAAAIADSAIDAATFATGAITASAFAANCLTADKLATDAVTEIVGGVWNAAIASYAVSGSTGEAIASASSAGDPWSTALPGAYAAGTAGYIVGNRLAAMESGTADSGSTTTMVDAARTEATDDYWKGAWIKFTSGTLDGQTRLITGFTASSDTITFAPATTAAVSTHTYEILPAARVDVGQWVGSTPNALSTGRLDVEPTNTATERNAIADALIDRVNVFYTGYSLRDLGKILISWIGGKASRSGSTIIYRDPPDTKDVVTMVVDGSNNRTTVTLDP